MLVKYVRTNTGQASRYGATVDGLIDYLFGEGNDNEHENQRVITSSLAMFYDDKDADNTPERVQKIKDLMNEFTPKDVSKNSRHIKHFIIATRPEEPAYNDWEWDQVAQEFARHMKFYGDDPRDNIRWVAVNHGKNKAGADHLHIAVNVFNARGKRWSDSMIGLRCQKAEEHLENQFYFVKNSPNRKYDRSKKSYTKDEFEQNAIQIAREKYEDEKGAGAWDKLSKEVKKALAGKTQEYELPRRELERRVRLAMCVSSSEDEFIRELRKDDVLIKPRFDKTNPGQVVGYQVALRKKDGYLKWNENQYWYGGSKLANDLTINRIREEFADIPDPSERTPDFKFGKEVHQTSSKALDEWKAAQTHQKPMWGKYGSETKRIKFKNYQVDRCSAKLMDFRDILQNAISTGKPQNMARTSRYLSATFTAFNKQYPDPQSPFSRIADHIAISAETKNNARYRGTMDIKMEWLKTAGQIIMSGFSESTALAVLLTTIMEITLLQMENRRLEGDLYNAKGEWGIIYGEINSQLHLIKNDELAMFGKKINDDIIIEQNIMGKSHLLSFEKALDNDVEKPEYYDEVKQLFEDDDILNNQRNSHDNNRSNT